MFQAGRFGSGDIRAWRSVIEGSHLPADAVWSPRLGLVLDAASGDKNPAHPNLQTFNAMFQSGTYSGRAQLLGPSTRSGSSRRLRLRFAASEAMLVDFQRTDLRFECRGTPSLAAAPVWRAKTLEILRKSGGMGENWRAVWDDFRNCLIQGMERNPAILSGCSRRGGPRFDASRHRCESLNSSFAD